MILPDLNVLVYAYDSSAPQHERAAKWWTGCMNGTEPVGLAWVTVLGFIRLWTSSRVFAEPMTVEMATGCVQTWLRRRNVQLLNPGPRHAELLIGMLRAEGRGGNLTTDAHLAALAMEHGAVICSSDVDFARFEGLEWRNPLA